MFHRFTGIFLVLLTAACAGGDSVEGGDPGSGGTGGRPSGGGGDFVSDGGSGDVGGDGAAGGGIPCGNGLKEPGEECDGDDLGGVTCADLVGPDATGTVICTERCVLDAGGCANQSACGNGAIDPGEVCDGDDLAGKTCALVIGPGSMGTLACTTGCMLDPSGCGAPSTCGNGTVDAGEACDGADVGGATCAGAIGPGSTGTVTCSSECALDASGCSAPTSCGDGHLDAGEECDDGNTTNGDGCDACTVVCLAAEKKLGSSCYVDVPNHVTWQDAKSQCEASLGGHLVTIGNQAENDFVWLDVMDSGDTGARWIGLHDEITEGTWIWTTGEPLVFVNWNTGEPNNSGNEDCAEFYYSSNDWNDEGCADSNAFICEYDPPVLLP